MTTAPKRGPGRPPKSAEDRRSESTLLRWTVAELAQIDAAAERLGTTRSELIREAALGRAKRAR